MLEAEKFCGQAGNRRQLRVAMNIDADIAEKYPLSRAAYGVDGGVQTPLYEPVPATRTGRPTRLCTTRSILIQRGALLKLWSTNLIKLMSPVPGA